jgi:membrane fusion protein (multidrug efflux system)
VRIAHLDRLRATFPVPERYAAVLKAGARATVGVTAWPGEEFPAWVTVVEPSIDPTSRTFTAVAEVKNVGGRLRPGMSADVNVRLTERGGALTVPDEAVLAEGDQTFVYKVGPDSSVSRVPVTLGARMAAQVEVKTGLVAGDRVVRAGHQKIFPGAKVMPVASLPRGCRRRPAPRPRTARHRRAARPRGQAGGGQGRGRARREGFAMKLSDVSDPAPRPRDGDEPGHRAVRSAVAHAAARARVPRHRVARRQRDHDLPWRQRAGRRDRDHRRDRGAALDRSRA